MRSINITPVLNGFLVQVGCQTLVFPSMEVLAVELLRYDKDPVAVEIEYMKKQKAIRGQPEVAQTGVLTGRVTGNQNIGSYNATEGQPIRTF